MPPDHYSRDLSIQTEGVKFSHSKLLCRAIIASDQPDAFAGFVASFGLGTH